MANLSSLPSGSAEVAENLANADRAQGVPDTGHGAITAASGGTGEANHPDPSIGGILDGTVIVSIAMAVFIAILLWKKVPALITGGLDRQIAAIRQRLDEAKQLRAEAEALRDEYAKRIAGAEAEAQAMLHQAEEEARALTAKAEADAAELTQRRAKMAEDKIAAAERAAVAEVRASAADAAARAAAALIAQRHDAAGDKALVDRTIADLGAGLGRPN